MLKVVNFYSPMPNCGGGVGLPHLGWVNFGFLRLNKWKKIFETNLSDSFSTDHDKQFHTHFSLHPCRAWFQKFFSFFAHFAMPPPLDPLSTVRNGRVQFFSVFLYFMLFCNKKRMTQSFFIQLPSVSPDSILIGPLIRILMRHPPKASRSDTCTHTPTDTHSHSQPKPHTTKHTHTHKTLTTTIYTGGPHTHPH